MTGGLLSRPREKDRGRGWSLRLLPAWEAMEARAEGEELAGEGREGALCANACLLARALRRDKKPAFESGRAVLETLTAGQIGDLAHRWGEFDRENNPSALDGEEAVDGAKKAWSARLMSAFSGVCSRLLGRCPPRRGPGR